MRKLIPLFSAILLAAGCASAPKTIVIHATESRAAVPIQSVTIVQQMPPGSVLIADLYSSGPFTPAGAQAAQADMKKNAAAIGANTLVVDNLSGGSAMFWGSDEFRIQGQAYFTPPASGK